MEYKTNTLLCTHFVHVYRLKSIISWKPRTIWPPSSVYRWNLKRNNTVKKRKRNCKSSPGGKSKVVIITDSSNRTGLRSFWGWVVHRDRPGPQAPGFLLLNLKFLNWSTSGQYFGNSTSFACFQGTVEKQREQLRDLDSELSNVKVSIICIIVIDFINNNDSLWS